LTSDNVDRIICLNKMLFPLTPSSIQFRFPCFNLFLASHRVYPANLNSPSRPHLPRQIGHSPCPTLSPVHLKIHVQQNKCPHSEAVGSFIGSRQSGHLRLPRGIKGRRISSARSMTSSRARFCVAIKGGDKSGWALAEISVGPVGAAFLASDSGGVEFGERIDVRSEVVGLEEEASCGEVNERYDWVRIWRRRRRPRSSYPGRCSPGNNRRVNIFN